MQDGSGGSSGSGGSGNSGGSSSGGSSNLTPSSCGDGSSPFVVSAAEENNLDFSSTITLDPVMVAPESVPQFDWSGLTQNFLGHTLEEGDVTHMILVVWQATPAEIADMINTDDPDINDFAAYSLRFPVEGGVTSASAADFNLSGSDVTEEEIRSYLDPAEWDPEIYSYTLIAQGSITPGQDAQMIQSFQVDEDTTNETVAIGDTSTDLTYTADLPEDQPTLVPADEPNVTMSWNMIDQHSYGGEGSFVSNQITQVLVGRYSLTPQEIEEDFLSLELIADDIWRADVQFGTDLDLSTLEHEEDGSTFPGVTDDGSTWAIALLCTDCVNPTPWYVSILETCE